MASWTGNPSMATPLLSASVQQNRRTDSTIEISDSSHGALAATPPRGIPLHFFRRLRHLLTELRPYQAISLAVLSILESIVVAQIGKVAGSFYQIVIDKQPTAFLAAILHAAFLYAACVALSTAAIWLSGRLAVQWRHHLTALLHRQYCTQLAFLRIGTDNNRELDNPDQRITAETAALCDALASAVRLAAGAPFRVFYYSYLSWQYLGWTGPVAAVAFFWVFAALQRIVVVPLARCLVTQERKEGDLRFAHLRLRDRAADVAAYRGAGAELACLNSALWDAVSNQRILVHWRAAMTATTKGTDYAGALLNYIIVGAAVFSGAASAASSGGELAQFVSNASFASLSLIYSFTEMLDLGEQLSSLAALTARVLGLVEALPRPFGRSGSGEAFPSDTYFNGRERHAGGGGSSGEIVVERMKTKTRAGGAEAPGGGPSSSTLELSPSDLATLLHPPTLARFIPKWNFPMEVSVHSLGTDLQIEARGIFPEAPAVADAHLLCVMTFQFAGGGAMELSPDRSVSSLTAAAAEMDRLLDCFLRWEAAMRAAVASRGPYWCDAIDPRTGTALHGRSDERWSEVAAARALLRYDKKDVGVCPLVVHPIHGTSAYPASFFTDAPAEVLCDVLSSLSDTLFQPKPLSRGAVGREATLGSQQQQQQESVRDGGGDSFLMDILGLTFSIPDNRAPLVSDFALKIRSNEWVLISGPNGAGKSTLLRVLSGLHPAAATTGTVLFGSELHALEDPFSDPTAAMMLPQRPLAAPGPALWQQLAYPGTNRPPDTVLRALCFDVGLAHILERTVGGLEATHSEWSNCLSPGEMQRLSIARVLLHRPRLVLLDEPCSAMGEAAAGQLLRLLRAAGVTCVTVAQDTEVYRDMHAVHVKLGTGGRGWQAELGSVLP